MIVSLAMPTLSAIYRLEQSNKPNKKNLLKKREECCEADITVVRFLISSVLLWPPCTHRQLYLFFFLLLICYNFFEAKTTASFCTETVSNNVSFVHDESYNNYQWITTEFLIYIFIIHF